PPSPRYRNLTFTSGLFSKCVVSTNCTRAGFEFITTLCVRTPSPVNRTPMSRFHPSPHMPRIRCSSRRQLRRIVDSLWIVGPHRLDPPAPAQRPSRPSDQDPPVQTARGRRRHPPPDAPCPHHGVHARPRHAPRSQSLTLDRAGHVVAA